MKYLVYIAIFNIIGVVLSISYGLAGGSGGETTSGVFYGIAFTGVMTIIASAILPLIKWEIFKSKWYWLLLLVILGITESSILDWKTILNQLAYLT
tara:strand:- start:257 stop:544 length:288 start_codon:yes stop_codon:yes gene_type:complete